LCVIVSGVSVLLCARQLKRILSLALRYQLTNYSKIGNNYSKLSLHILGGSSIVLSFLSYSIADLDRPLELLEIETSRILDDLHMKVVSLSALDTGRLYLPGDIPGTHFCYRQSRLPSLVRPEGLNQRRILVIPQRIETATFHLETPCLNQLISCLLLLA
jgi:hypothetical protein